MRLIVLNSICFVLAFSNVARSQSIASPDELDQEKFVETELAKYRELTRVAEGGDSPEDVVRKYVSAARAGSVDGMLGLIDPKVRSLVALEVAAERAISQSAQLEQLARTAFKQEPKTRAFGFSTIYAESDLIRIVDIKIKHTRRLDEDRTVLRVIKTIKSSGQPDAQRIEQDILAVRRDQRWYLFTLIGHMLWTCRMSLSDMGLSQDSADKLGFKGDVKVSVLSHATVSNSESSPVDQVEVLSVPIEDIHQNCQDVSNGKWLSRGQEAIRFHAGLSESIRGRLMRGDIQDWDAWQKLERPDEKCTHVAAACVSQCMQELWLRTLGLSSPFEATSK